MKASDGGDARGKPAGAPYVSPLRDAQAAATRQQILDAVATLIERGEEPTFASMAKEAGVQERTVYRHFPSKEELYEAFWWMVVDARLGRTGYDAADLPALVRDIDATFRAFDGNAKLVTEMLHSRYGLAMRLRTNDRRTAMFERVVRAEVPGADARTRRRAAAVAQLLYSGAAWEMLRNYWGMDAGEAVAAVSQALTAMFDGLRAAPPGKRRAPRSSPLPVARDVAHPVPEPGGPPCCFISRSARANPSGSRASSPRSSTRTSSPRPARRSPRRPSSCAAATTAAR